MDKSRNNFMLRISTVVNGSRILSSLHISNSNIVNVCVVRNFHQSYECCIQTFEVYETDISLCATRKSPGQGLISKV